MAETQNQDPVWEEPSISDVLSAVEEASEELEGRPTNITISAGGYGEYAVRIFLAGEADYHGVRVSLY